MHNNNTHFDLDNLDNLDLAALERDLEAEDINLDNLRRTYRTEAAELSLTAAGVIGALCLLGLVVVVAVAWWVW